jgi:hypothetical protein
MPNNSELFKIVDNLVDGWCESRALQPLRHILDAYPLSNGLTDDWERLHEALRSVRAFCRDQLSAEEQEQLGRAVVLVQKILDRR